MSYLDVRNEVANYSLEFRQFKRKNTVLVIYSMIENRKEAINNRFKDLKARSKIQMKRFKVKLTRF